MGNFVRFTDSVNLVPLEIPKEVKDYYETAVKQGLTDVKPLRVRIAATHSGKITRNNGFYLPQKMQDGAKTFISQYQKPIQIHHKDKEDPIGRVIAAEYIDLSGSIRDSLQDSINVAEDKLLQGFVAGTLSWTDSIDFANQWIINDFKISADPDYEGLGYIEIVTNITDPDAIQKILDGRYLTGSVGASTNRAVCSVCKQDWASDEGKCTHRPGKIYDGAKCVIIAGDLIYDEYSFVNKPADRHSRVIEVNINGIQDFVTLDNNDHIPEVILVIDKQDHSKEEQSMTFKDALALAQKQDKFKDKETLMDDVKRLVDEDKDLSEETLCQKLDAFYNPKEEKEDAQGNSDPICDFFGEEYEELIGDDTSGREYAEMLYTLVEDAKTDEEREEAVKTIKEAKLSSAQRKKLSSSTFCGPNRSFPVNDCAHYTAALRLVSRYKGPGNKSSIRSCIERKGRRLGCSSASKKDFVLDELTVDAFDKYEEEDLANLFDVLQEVMKERKMDCGCNNASAEELEDAAKQATEQAQKEIKELKDRLNITKKEIRYLHNDIESLMNSVADEVALTREIRVQRIVDMRMLKGEEVDLEKIADELKEKNSEDLTNILKDLSTQVDMQKIVDTLNSGISNNPTETVPDPTTTQDNTKSEKKMILQDKDKQNLKLNWLKIRTAHGQDTADKWLDETCKQHNINIEEVMPKQEQS